MNRRVFLRDTMTVSVLSSLAISGGLKEYFLASGQAHSGHDDKILVLIQLDGGNDGLNTVIPLDQYENLTRARKNLLIPENKILALNNSAITGLHPSLTGLQKLYNDKQLTIVQGVGITNPDLSHFKAIDIWHSGSDSASVVTTGWLGRVFDEQDRSKIHRDKSYPPAIQIGSSLSKALQGPAKSVGMMVGNTNSFYDISIGHYDGASFDPAGDQLAWLRSTAIESKEYLQKVKKAAQSQKNISNTYPPEGKNELADQLKIVAQLIGGGMQTKVYMVTLKGFDTHGKQVDPSDTTTGEHADLLSKVSTAITAFQDDLQHMGRQDDVLGMVYSEFGRRIRSNASYGCDHGTSAPVLLFGSKLKGGLIGQNPHISAKVNVNDNLPMQKDFRSVYASVLKGWFGLPDRIINSSLLGKYESIDLFKV